MKVFEIDGHAEVVIDEPFVMGPELVPGQGRLVRGRVTFLNKDSNLSAYNHNEDIVMSWPVWFGELQGMLNEGDGDVFCKLFEAGGGSKEEATCLMKE